MEAADCRSPKEILAFATHPEILRATATPLGHMFSTLMSTWGPLKAQTLLSRCGGLRSPALPRSSPQGHALSEKVCGFRVAGRDSGHWRNAALSSTGGARLPLQLFMG